MMTSEQQTKRDAALWYAERGLPVFPVHYIGEDGVCSCGGPEKNPKCKPAKHPIPIDGHKDATTDRDVVRRWWIKHPEANIGMPTGRRSGILVLDGDGEKGVRTLEESGYSEDAPKVRTGSGGTHVYASYPEEEEIRNSAGKIAPGLDVRSEGGYVLLPPSRNANGPYEWERELDGDLPEPPLWFLNLIRRQAEEKRNGKDGLDTARVLAGLPEGERDDGIYRFACKLRHADVPQDAAEELAKTAARNCEPPFPEAEALEKVERAYREYTPGSSTFPGTNATNAHDTLNAPGSMPPAVPFPLDALPPSLAWLVVRGAASLHCQPDFIATGSLAALGGAIGSTRVLQVTPDGWEEYADLWVTIVGGPGSKKSPALKLAMNPVFGLQKDFVDRHEFEMQRYREEMLPEWETKKADKQKGDPTPAKPPKPQMRHAFVKDITIEGLGVRLNDEPRGLTVYRGELSGLFRSMDQYKAKGKGSERQDYLDMWSNDAVKVDRKGGDESIYVPEPVLSIAGGIQPDVLTDLTLPGEGPRRDAKQGESPGKSHKDDGMVHRFLFSYPNALRIIDDRPEPMPPGAKLRYRAVYRSLRDLERGLDDKPVKVRFTEEGEERFWAEKRQINREKFRPGFPAPLGYTWDKMDSQLARLSLLLAMVRFVSEGDPEAVTEGDVDRASRILRYYMAHARRAHAKIWGESKQQRWLWLLNDLLDERGDTWKVASKELYRAFEERGVRDLPERTEDFIAELHKMAERTEGLDIETGKWIESKHRGVWVRRTPLVDDGRAQHADGVGGVGAQESDKLAPDLIRMVLEEVGEAYPKEIAEATGLSPKTITNNIPGLIDDMVVDYTGKKGPGGSRQIALTDAFMPEWKKNPVTLDVGKLN